MAGSGSVSLGSTCCARVSTTRGKAALQLESGRNSRLRLLRKSTVQRCWIKRVLHAVTQDIDDIDARIRARAGLVIAADASRGEAEVGCAAAGRRARV